MRRVLRATILFLIILTTAATQAQGVQRVITLDDPGASDCYDGWLEGNCWIELVNTTGADCEAAGICFFNGDIWPGGLYFPYRMLVNLENVTGIETVEVLVYDGWEDGCVQVFLYSGAALLDLRASVNHGNWETLILAAGGSTPTQLVISGWDGAVDEIRLVGGELTPVETGAWGMIKSLY